MSLSPLINVPISRQDSLIEVVSLGDGSHDHDEVFVSTTLTLAQDIDPTATVTAILPLATDAQQQPLLRYVSDDVRGPQALLFEEVGRSAYDQAVASALAALADGETKREAKRLDTAIRAAAKSFSQVVLTIQPGQRQLRFFYTLRAPSLGNREFEFRVLGPLASFIIQPGGSISVASILPRGATQREAVALQDPANPGTALPLSGEADIAGRHVTGWVWQNDPLFRVKYAY